MKKCVMCSKEFQEIELDWCGRCEPCFRWYLTIPNGEKKPHMGIPHTPVSKAVK